MMVLLKSLLFAISTVGSFELIRKVSKDEVNIYFLPSLTVAIQVCVLFMAGLLNLLSEAVYGLYLLGFVGFIYSICKNKSLSSLKSYLNLGYILMLALLLIFSMYLRGKVFKSFDNYSHWALVVKQMLTTNRYPNFKDTLIAYQEYPLGSASYIYYFVKLTKTSESFQMLAQTYMMLAAVLPLYAFAKKNHLAVSIAVVSFINYVLLCNSKITELYVDTLLPLVGICGLLFVYQHCKEGRKIMLCFAACYMVQVMQIKNSGIFFVVFIAIYLLSFSDKQYMRIHHWVCIAVPFISLLLWHKHCDYVFESADTTTHAMTTENFLSVFGEKSQENISTICTKLFKFAVSYKGVWITVGICAFIGVLILLARKEIWKLFRKIAAFSLVIYVTYMIGMLGMYLFSMPVSEALRLASGDRYTRTILIAILYLNMVPAVMMISDLSGKHIKTVFTTACVFVSFFVGVYFSLGTIMTVLQYKYDAAARNWIAKAIRKYDVQEDSSYCILIPSDDNGYAKYVIRYLFYTTEVTSTVVHSEEDLNEIDAKYIFVYNRKNEVIQNWIQDNYPKQFGNDVIVRAGE